MKRQSRTRLPAILESFFCDYLQQVRGASRHTIRAYRDTLRLLLIYAADDRQRTVADLQLTDLDVDVVKRFLTHLETQRANTVATRNCRLAAIRGFYRHALRHDPEHAQQYHRVLSLPSKKANQPAATYLEPEDVRLLLAQPNRRTPLGRRDHALLLFLYNTGARVGEALSVHVHDVQLAPPAQVRLHGKGQKDRFCPLWPETTKILRTLDTVCHGQRTGSLFLNARQQPLSRDGVAYILNKHAAVAAIDCPTIARMRVTPHVLRHSCAVALLQAGVDVTVIRDYLGHASVSTTSRYITTNLQMKRDALEAFWESAGIAPAKVTPWAPKPDVLAFLESL